MVMGDGGSCFFFLALVLSTGIPGYWKWACCVSSQAMGEAERNKGRVGEREKQGITGNMGSGRVRLPSKDKVGWDDDVGCGRGRGILQEEG